MLSPRLLFRFPWSPLLITDIPAPAGSAAVVTNCLLIESRGGPILDTLPPSGFLMTLVGGVNVIGICPLDPEKLDDALPAPPLRDSVEVAVLRAVVMASDTNGIKGSVCLPDGWICGFSVRRCTSPVDRLGGGGNVPKLIIVPGSVLRIGTRPTPS